MFVVLIGWSRSVTAEVGCRIYGHNAGVGLVLYICDDIRKYPLSTSR